MDLVIGDEASPYFSNLFRVPLSSSKVLWEVRSRSEWEKTYATYWGSLDGGKGRLESVGDATLAHMQRSGLSKTTPIVEPRGIIDALDDWHADMDGLGMLLAAVIADLS